MSDERPVGQPVVVNRGTAMSVGLVMGLAVLCATPLIYVVRTNAQVIARFDIQQIKVDANTRAVQDVKSELALQMQRGFLELGAKIDEKTQDRLTRTMFAHWIDLANAKRAPGEQLPPPPK